MNEKILVIGDLMIDHYLRGKCERISPEAPVQIVDIDKEDTVLGGAGNLVNNLVSLNVKVEIVSVIGDDDNGLELRRLLETLGVKSYLIEESGRKTSKKTRVMASHSHVLRFDKETKKDISKQSEDDLLSYLSTVIQNYEVVLLSDYAKGVLTHSVTKKVIELASRNNKKVLIDPKGADYSKYKNAHLLTPNKKELELATNCSVENEASLIKALQKLKQITNVAVPMVTLSENGIAILIDDKVIKKPTVAKEVFDVTGAGDTVLASLGYCLSKNKNILTAIEFANLAAGVVVGKIGSATATLEDIEEYKSSLHRSSSTTHIKSFQEIEQLSKKFHKLDKKIVFTNGCFDILHAGHVKYLEVAKSYGDVLIVGVNTDGSVRKLKGSSRPVNNQDDRAYILASLESVDFVVIFDEETPYELIELIKPNILVKGQDYEGKDVVGEDIADELKLVQFVDGKSTTSTIEKIQCNS